MLSFLTNALNAVLLFLVALAPFLPWRGREAISGRAVAEFWARSLAGIGVGVALAESGKKWEVWAGHPAFPSGHETLALAAATSLACRDRRWLAVGLPLAALQAWALVTGHFHTPEDVTGALVTGIVPPLAAHLLGRRR